MEIKKIVIIGAGGKMGKWFAKFFAKKGVEVFATDIDKAKLFSLKKIKKINLVESNEEAIKSAELLLISVLLKNFEEVVKEISPHLKENQIVIDICSLKEKPVQIMHHFLKRNLILGTHPLFGPLAQVPKQNFILTPTNPREKKLAKEFGCWLREKGFKVIMMSPQKHDELMTVILGLAHFIGLVSGSTISNLNVRELKRVSGPSFKKLLDLIQSVVLSSPEFYSELHLNLPKINKIENSFEKEVRAWRKIIKSKNRQKFIKKMLKIKNTLQKKYELVDIDRAMSKFSEWLKNKIKSKNNKFSEGFITASLLFCMGSMAILGAIEEGLGGAPNLLLAKSILDGFSSIVLSASLGIGVIFSAIPLLIYQG